MTDEGRRTKDEGRAKPSFAQTPDAGRRTTSARYWARVRLERAGGGFVEPGELVTLEADRAASLLALGLVAVAEKATENGDAEEEGPFSPATGGPDS